MRDPSAVVIGPKGLPLPVWKPEYEQQQRRVEIEKAQVLATRTTDASNEAEAVSTDWVDTHEYWTSKYWQERYAAGVVDEWYCPAHVLMKVLPKPPTHAPAAAPLGHQAGEGKVSSSTQACGREEDQAVWYRNLTESSAADRMMAELRGVKGGVEEVPATERMLAALQLGEGERAVHPEEERAGGLGAMDRMLAELQSQHGTTADGGGGVPRPAGETGGGVQAEVATSTCCSTTTTQAVEASTEPAPRQLSVLIVGDCRPDLALLLLQAGYGHVTAIDVVEQAIEAMAAEHADNPALEFRMMDVTDMSAFQNESFDLVIDKGVLDALLTGGESGSITSLAVKEIHRVTKMGGTFISASHSMDRTDRLRPPGLTWTIASSRCVYDIEKSGDPNTDGIVFFKYECVKTDPMNTT